MGRTGRAAQPEMPENTPLRDVAQNPEAGSVADSRGFRPLWWFVVLLAVPFFLPRMVSAYYLPKVAWAAFAIAFGYLATASCARRAWRLTPLGMVWAAYLLWAALSAWWAPSPRVVLDRWLFLVLITCAHGLARRTRFWESEIFWTLFWGLMVALCVVGFAQNMPDAGQKGSLAWYLGGWMPSRGHPSITMGYRNQAAMFLSLVLPFAFWRGFAARRRAAGALALLAATLMLIFIVIARSRAAWVGLAGGLGFVILLGLRHRLRAAPSRAYGVFALLVIALLVVPLVPRQYATTLMSKPVPRLKQGLVSALASIPRGGDEGRLDMWRLGLRHYRPLGIGLGCSPMVLSVDRARVLQLNWELHNDYVQNLIDLGIPGLLLFLAVLAALLHRIWRGRNDGACLAAGMSVVTLAIMLLFTFVSRHIDSLLWMAVAVAVLGGACGDRDGLAKLRLSLPRRMGLVLDILLAAALAAYGALAARAAWADHVLFRNLEKPDTAIERLASDILPRMRVDTTVAHMQAHQYALLALRGNAPRSAEAFALRGLAIYPTDRSLYQVRAMAAYHEGRLIDAVRHQEQAVALEGERPSALSLQRLSAYYRAAGLTARAAEAARRARYAAAPKLENR